MEASRALTVRTRYPSRCGYHRCKETNLQLKNVGRESPAVTFRWFFCSLRHPVFVFISVFAYLLILSPLPGRCQSSHDPCEANNLCENNSTCIKWGYDFKCKCTNLEYTGWYCNVSVSIPCNEFIVLNRMFFVSEAYSEDSPMA